MYSKNFVYVIYHKDTKEVKAQFENENECVKLYNTNFFDNTLYNWCGINLKSFIDKYIKE